MAGAVPSHHRIHYSQLGLHHCSRGHRYCVPQVRIRPLTQQIHYMTRKVCWSWKHRKYTERFQMSTLIACPLRHPRTLSADCFATCEATEFQISIRNLWIINSFGQNTALLAGNSGTEQLLDLIGIQTRLCVWLTKKTHAQALLLGSIEWKYATLCMIVHPHTTYLSSSK